MWYFFNWSMLVGSVKGFAFKSINVTTLLEYICLIIHWPAQFCLNFPFVSWIGAWIHFSTKSPNFKSLVLTFLSKAHFLVLFSVNGHPFQWEGLLLSHTPMNKEWLRWKIELMSYIPKVHRAIVDANPLVFCAHLQDSPYILVCSLNYSIGLWTVGWGFVVLNIELSQQLLCFSLEMLSIVGDNFMWYPISTNDISLNKLSNILWVQNLV